MRWTALNGVGAMLWVAGLYLANSVEHPGAFGAWIPPNPFLVASVFGIVGLAMLLWANLVDA